MLPQNHFRTRRDLSPPRIQLNIAVLVELINRHAGLHELLWNQTDFSNMSYQLDPLTFSSVNSPEGLICTLRYRGLAFRFRNAEMDVFSGSA